MKTPLKLVLVNCFLITTAFAQDSHFSQFDANPFYINPALSGERLSENKGIQINASFRDQVSKYSKATGSSKNIALGVDEPITSKFTAGQFFYNDKSATGSFNTAGLLLAGAYKIIDQSADGADNQNLSVGLQLGAYNKSIRPAQFTYDAQYSINSSDGFDRSISSGETFQRESYFGFHLNFGIYYRSTSKNKKNTVFGGLAFYNIAQSNKSFLGTFSPLPLRFNLHAGAVCVLTKLLTVMPQVLYMNQADATEFNFGALMFYKIEGTLYEPIFGLSFRNKDAVIFQLGLKYQDITFRASYDVITNPTKVYRNRGIEFSLVYTLKKKTSTSKKKPAASIEMPPASIEVPPAPSENAK
jgi:type IX secretion system PorP/SprF family membrane protein